jgi:hypothetical protein
MISELEKQDLAQIAAIRLHAPWRMGYGVMSRAPARAAML